jgi:hypothetical protein
MASHLPAWWRDRWAWVSVFAVVPLVVHSLSASLGTPVADDFELLHYTLYSARFDWLSGGGSETFWRPLAYQGYYGLFSQVFLSWPRVVVVLHVVMLAVTALLVYRTARRFMPAPWAAATATFPLLAESTRALIIVPVHFVDVGLLLFSAIAFHEAAARRMPTALIALLAALLCKETAVATACAMPWLSRGNPRRNWPWAVAVALVTLAWGFLYLAVRARHALTLPRGLESNLAQLGTQWPERYGWAIANSARAIFSLPAVPSTWDAPLAIVLSLVFAGAVTILWRNAAARARLAGVGPLLAVGLAWSAIATAPLATVHPIWSPQRVAYGSLGAGMALSAGLGAVHPGLLAGLVAARLSMFAMSPGPPRTLTGDPPETGAFVDYEKLARVQWVLSKTRQELQERFPTLRHGSGVVFHHLPHSTFYAFSQGKSLQLWYRDTTLRWISFEAFNAHPDLDVATVVEYQASEDRPIVLIDPEAIRCVIRANQAIAENRHAEALALLDRAEQLGPGPGATVFRGLVLGPRAICVALQGDRARAEAMALESTQLWPDEPSVHLLLGLLWGHAGRFDDAEAQARVVLSIDSTNVGAWKLLALLDSLRSGAVTP